MIIHVDVCLGSAAAGCGADNRNIHERPHLGLHVPAWLAPADETSYVWLCSAAVLLQAVVLTTGTFMNGRIWVGRASMAAGRAGEAPSTGLTEMLVALGFETDRLKTGTPARVDSRTVNFKGLEEQPGEWRCGLLRRKIMLLQQQRSWWGGERALNTHSELWGTEEQPRVQKCVCHTAALLRICKVSVSGKARACCWLSLLHHRASCVGTTAVLPLYISMNAMHLSLSVSLKLSNCFRVLIASLLLLLLLLLQVTRTCVGSALTRQCTCRGRR
jgi:hypothetical protein